MNNRQIKFRIWSKEYKQWMNHCSVIDSDGYVLILYYEQKEEGQLLPMVFHCPPDSVVVQQYTGLKDSTGKEIYEGDIFESESVYKWEPVEFEDGKFVVNLRGARLYDLCELFDGDFERPKIAGNIFETPELLA